AKPASTKAAATTKVVPAMVRLPTTHASHTISLSSFDNFPKRYNTSVDRSVALTHVPAKADDDRLPGERARREGRQHEGHFGDVGRRGELLVDRVAQHHVAHHLCFGDAEFARLFGDLLVDERRSHKSGADNIGAHAVPCALLGHCAAETEKPVLGRDI